jgi:hypothetical protein
LSTNFSLRCHVFASHAFSLDLEDDDPVDGPVWIRQDDLQGLSLFVGINYPIFHEQPPDDVAQAGQSAEQGQSLFQQECVFDAYHRAHPYYRPVLDWSCMHVNGGARSVGERTNF